MLGTVIQIDGYDPVAGKPVTLCAASHDEPVICHLNNGTWWPVIAKLPTLRYDLFDGAFAGQITAPSSSLSLVTEIWPDFGRYQLADARLRLWTGNVGDAFAAWTLRFDGRVTGQPQMKDGRADIDFAADDSWLDKAVLTTYAGTTGAEGTADLKGQPKPLALGAPRYVAGKLIDSVNSVFQFSAYGAVQSVEAAMEKLARFPAPVANYATYAALVAATIPAGQWATAKAVGMARFGAPPTGQISFLVQGDYAGAVGWARTVGQIIRRLAELAGASGKLDIVSLTALDVARPYPVSLYLDEQTTCRDLIQKLAASINAVAGISWTGQLFVAPVGLGAASILLSADGSSLPPVSSVEQIENASPWQRLALTAERAWTVHQLGDIAFTAALVDLGLYAPATTYREGNIVSLADGSRWLFVATTPAVGVAPVAGAVWQSLSGPVEVDWNTQVSGDGKPEDNATVGAPAGTPVAGVEAGALVTSVTDARSAIYTLNNVTIPAVNAAIAKARSDAAADVADAKTQANQARSDAAQVATDLATEVSRAKGAEGTITTSLVDLTTKSANNASAITSETTQRTTADNALSNRIDQVVASSGTNATNISTEITARTNADGALGGRIDNLTTTVGGNITAISTEATARATADSALGGRIDSLTTTTGQNTTAINNEVTARTNADSALAARSASLEATAVVGDNSTNANPKFSAWPDGQELPAGWSWWAKNGSITRVARSGAEGGWTAEVASPGTANHGIGIGNVPTGGWAVLEVDVELTVGNWLGSGVSLSGGYALDFSRTADSTGLISTAPNTRRRFTSLINIDPSYATLTLIAHTQWSGFPGATGLKTIRWHRLSLRPATAADVQAGKATSDITTLVARVGTEETARSNAVSALAARDTTLEAQMANTQGSGLQTRVATEETARVAGDSALATRTTTLEARTVGGGNLLKNTDFDYGNGFDTWNVFSQNTFGVNGPDANWVIAGINSLWVHASSGSGTFGFYTSPDTPASGGRTYEVSADVACHRTNRHVSIEWYDVNYNRIGDTPTSPWYGPTGGGNTLNGYSRIAVRGQAPSGAVWIRMVVRGQGDVFGQGDPYLWFCRPMIAEVASLTGDPLPYSPGGKGKSLDNAARIADEATARSTNDSALASRTQSLETRAGNLESSVTTQAGAISALAGKTAAYWQTTTVAGNNRAQLTVHADANGGAGVDIVGDVAITGAQGGGTVSISGRGFVMSYNGINVIEMVLNP